MNIILTHEQADFDAIAGLLGTSLIQGSALPVLPRKMNRNVRSFLSLHGSELPFVEARDLSAGVELELVTLVDTQSLVTLKGFTRKTRVQVIDHHMEKGTLDPEWSVRCEQVGAVTTLLVEAIQESTRRLTTTQSTLLLLGIYEDTGSLSYASTTSRDIRAAAYLLEQGASLSIAINYLNPPLSEEQRLVNDRLLEKAETHLIHGLRIVIAATSALEISEEVSSIAHKMRDLLEPDGLIIIVATEEGYRLVLRSTSDQVNVALIATHFNGGGHERAAAALVHRPSGAGADKDAEELEHIKKELLRILPSMIQQPITVRQIMSRKPRLIPPSLSTAEASKLMQKYGYEGFPVVENGRVLGLLTRRSVDRSLAHKLDLPASSLMEAGSVVVSPEDTLDHLQEVMTETGWGQIPVFDTDKNEITGIVTRTDLLKVLSTRQPRKRVHHLASQLDGSLPVEQVALLKTIANQATKLGMAAYVVGGFVRDLILSRPVTDFDIVVEGDAICLTQVLVDKFGGRMVCHNRFGTAKWYLNTNTMALQAIYTTIKNPVLPTLPASLDLITARTEFYDHPTALPTVERSSIKLDLHRRDFTINTMAIRLDGQHYGELLDHYGGYNDLKKGVIRVLHSLSFIDDPTRAIRAIRFEQRFDFKIEERTFDLMLEAAGQLKSITGERIRHELDLLFFEERVSRMLNRLSETGLLSSIHPALGWDPAHSGNISQLLADTPSAEWELPERMWGHPLCRVLGYTFWLMNLTEVGLRSVIRRLHIPANIAEVIQQSRSLSANIKDLVGKAPSTICARLDDINLAAIRCVYYHNQDPAEQALIIEYILHLRKIEPGIDGHDLLTMGIPTGPHYRFILDELKGAWLDGKISSREQETIVLADLVRKYTSPSSSD